MQKKPLQTQPDEPSEQEVFGALVELMDEGVVKAKDWSALSDPENIKLAKQRVSEKRAKPGYVAPKAEELHQEQPKTQQFNEEHLKNSITAARKLLGYEDTTLDRLGLKQAWNIADPFTSDFERYQAEKTKGEPFLLARDLRLKAVKEPGMANRYNWLADQIDEQMKLKGGAVATAEDPPEYGGTPVAKSSAAPAPPPQPGAPAPSPDDPDTIENQFKTYGVKQDDIDKAILYYMGLFGIEDPSQPMNFKTGMRRVLSHPEFQPGLEKMLQSGQGGLSTFRYQRPDEEGKVKTPREVQQESDVQMLEQKYKQLAEAGDLQNFTSIVLFVFLSMILGPQNASLFFSKAAERGTLNAEIGAIRYRIGRRKKEDELREQREYEQAEWNRRQAVERELGMERQQQSAEERLRHALMVKMFEVRADAYKQAQKGGGDAGEKYLKDLDRQFNNAVALSKQYEFSNPALAKNYAAEAGKLYEEMAAVSQGRLPWATKTNPQPAKK